MSELPTMMPQRKRTDKRFAEAHGRERSSWQVTDMWDLHHQIKRRIFMGQKNVEIARILGCTKEQVSNVRNSDVVKSELAAMHKKADDEVVDVKQTINKMLPAALKAIEETLKGGDGISASTRFKAAQDVMDRAGHGAPQKNFHAHAIVDASAMQALKARARDLGVSSGIVVSAECDDVSVPSRGAQSTQSTDNDDNGIIDI